MIGQYFNNLNSEHSLKPAWNTYEVLIDTMHLNHPK